MLAAYNPPTQFMYGFNNRQHTMHSPNSTSPYTSSLPQLDQSGMDFAGGWSEAQPRYGAGTVHGFANEVPKNPSQSSVFGSSQSANNRGHYTSYSSERTTMQPFQQEWTSSSQQHIHAPAHNAPSASNHFYPSSFRQSVDFGQHPASEWNQWPENTTPVIGVRNNNNSSSTTHWSEGLRIPSLSSQSIEDLLYTSTGTSSPAYSVGGDLPQVPHGHYMSPISSPSPSPSTSSRKLSPHPSTSPTPSSRRGSVDASAPAKKCSHCHATSTPLWRREPTTHNPLCNACGLYLQQRHRHRPKELIDADLDDESEEEDDQNYTGPECSHCHTHRTSVWRRSKTGAQLCNACGVYARLRGKDRPLSLKRKKIKPRTKHASTPRPTS